MKKIAFVHYLVGERDGVSLEIEKRAEEFRKKGWEVSFISGFDGLKGKRSFVIPEFAIKNKFNIDLLSNLFENQIRKESEVYSKFHIQKEVIKKELIKIFKQNKFDLLYIHNVFSHAYNLPASIALLETLDEVKTKSVIVNHDFWFEREKFLSSKYRFVNKILEELPPDRSFFIKHQVINSISHRELKSRRGINAQRIGDYFNFDIIHIENDNFNFDIRENLGIGENDIIILQATRITPRKGIENAIKFLASFQSKLKNGMQLFNKTISSSTRVHLLLPNFVEVDSIEYGSLLRNYAESLGVNVIWGSSMFQPNRSIDENGSKAYSFWDSYLIADFITYPSFLEGFGNQFLEAVYFKKLPIVFEYPVFVRDIKPEGYEFVSLGQTVPDSANGLYLIEDERIENAVNETIEILSNKDKLNKITDKNFVIAKKNHNHGALSRDIDSVIESL